MASSAEGDIGAENLSKESLNRVDTNRVDALDSRCFSDLSDEMRDYVVAFLDKEVGSDLKSLRNVGSLLEKLKKDNSTLEKQVSIKCNNNDIVNV